MLIGSVLMSALALVGAGSGQRGAVPPELPAAASGADAVVQEPAPTIRTELDNLEITVGDPLPLTVVVEHDAGSTVVWPDSLDLGSFELLDAMMLEPTQQGDRVRSAVQLMVTAFELGDLEIPSFNVTVTGRDTTVLATDTWSVTVASVGRDESGDIRGIKGPLYISRNWLLLIPWILILGALAVGGYWLYRRYRATGRPVKQVLLAGPPLPPHEVAYEALDRLAGSGLLEQGNIKEYYIAVSDIIRRYVEGRYRVDALEMATYEVLQGLDDIGLDFDTRLEFERFLSDCDLVKFAKLRPALAACQEMIPRARRIVDGTREERDGVGEEGEAGEGEVVAVSSVSSSPSRGREGGGE